MKQEEKLKEIQLRYQSVKKVEIVSEKQSVPSSIPKEEVINRLRRLKYPATLFGEDDDARYQRLLGLEEK